ncbi:MAG: membrane protein insertase YidC [Desulfobacterales bacterium]|nr:membrane protein insertase YidC [Desulfobacteraceae bacterium]MBT4364759.1 membrane protein insertase YidC [Desulfobacteraceae bacterium]MBT7084627.1 membrane protein insertase YidC [Desulfobacterales bacterium]MBT7697397.1 membrane protein insertase YidC [Desulfobacterales bacterium]
MKTELLEISFSSAGGRIINWAIRQDPASAGVSNLYTIPHEPKNSSWDGDFLGIKLFVKGIEHDDHHVLYNVVQSQDKNFYIVSFDSPKSKTGFSVRKTYRIPVNGYKFEFILSFLNKSGSELIFDNGRHGFAIGLHSGVFPVDNQSLVSVQERVVYKTNKDINNLQLEVTKNSIVFPGNDLKIEWAGIHSRYDLFCLIPRPATGSTFVSGTIEQACESQVQENRLPALHLFHKPFSVKPGQSVDFSYTVFAGPKSRQVLEKTNYGLDGILFSNLWSWLRPVCLVLMSLLGWLHSISNSWGLAIVLLSVLMRVFIFPVSRYSIKKQRIFKEKQAELAPLIDAINGKYSDGEKAYQETMKLYKEHNFSPFASYKGCLGLLVQIPVFVALYQIICQYYQISGAGFLWINDLSEPERLFSFGITLPLVGEWFNFLPLIMCTVQIVQASMMNKSKDKIPGKKKSKGNMGVYILPVTMMVLFYQFAAGLLLYWTTTNLCQVIEQWAVNKRMEK